MDGTVVPRIKLSGSSGALFLMMLGCWWEHQLGLDLLSRVRPRAEEGKRITAGWSIPSIIL